MDDRTGGAIVGAVMPLLGKVVGFIAAGSFISTIALSALGAATGFFTTMLLRKLFKKKQHEQKPEGRSKGNV